MKLFLDACSIIYWIEMAEPQYRHFVHTLNKIRKKHPDLLFTSSYLSILECRVKPLREENEELLNQYQQFFCSTNLILMPMSLEVIEKATELRAFYQLRSPDAIQAATALSIDDEVIFITVDKNFKKIPNLHVLLV